jgi:hypothetical protein
MPKNKNIFLLLFLLLFSVGVLLLTPQAHAQTTGLKYVLLEKSPFFDGNDGSDLPKYIKAVYKTALFVIVLSAVLMLSIGGFMYLTSAGNTSALSTAKGVIFDSIIGLVIALTAWLLLNVINPDLVNVNINNLSPTAAAPGAPGGGTPPPPPSGTLASKAQQILGMSGVLLQNGDCASPSGVVSPRSDLQSVADGKAMAVCSNGCTSSGGCTDNAVNPSEKMLNAIITVKSSMGFTIQSIGGGSHSNNSAHYQGRALDVTPVTQALLDAFVLNGALAPNGDSASMCERSGKNVGCASGVANHIHLVF